MTLASNITQTQHVSSCLIVEYYIQAVIKFGCGNGKQIMHFCKIRVINLQ